MLEKQRGNFALKNARRHTSTNRNRFSPAQPYSCSVVYLLRRIRAGHPSEDNQGTGGRKLTHYTLHCLPTLEFAYVALFLLVSSSASPLVPFSFAGTTTRTNHRGSIDSGDASLFGSAGLRGKPACCSVTDKKINFPSFVLFPPLLSFGTLFSSFVGGLAFSCTTPKYSHNQK